MKWKDNLKLKPFSTDPGTSFIVPNTSFVCSAYPSVLKFSSLEDENFTKEISLDFGSHSLEFMVQQDLEKQMLKLFCKNEKGHYQIQVYAKDEKVSLSLKKGASDVKLHLEEALTLTKGMEVSLFSIGEKKISSHIEYLSTGVFKKQDVYQIRKRNSFNELAPFLFRLGQHEKSSPVQSSHQLLKACQKSVQDKDKLQFEKNIKELLSTSYQQFLVPGNGDLHHAGYKDLGETSCLELLKAPYKFIRDSLFYEEDGNVYLLPFLFKSFTCGYLSDIKSEYGLWDLVWSKGTLLRARFRAEKEGSYQINFPKGLKSCRLKLNRGKKGIDFISSGEVSFLFDDLVVFDRFLK